MAPHHPTRNTTRPPPSPCIVCMWSRLIDLVLNRPPVLVPKMENIQCFDALYTSAEAVEANAANGRLEASAREESVSPTDEYPGRNEHQDVGIRYGEVRGSRSNEDDTIQEQ